MLQRDEGAGVDRGVAEAAGAQRCEHTEEQTDRDAEERRGRAEAQGVGHRVFTVGPRPYATADDAPLPTLATVEEALQTPSHLKYPLT